MPSFDIVSRVELQELDNAVNNTKKEIETRYDFRGVVTELALNKGAKKLNIETGDEMKMRAVQDMLIGHCVRRKIDPRCLDFKDIEPTSKGRVKRDVLIKEGISKEIGQKVVKMIKESKLKVQAAIQDEQVRVTGKQIDDLQSVIRMVKEADLDVPMQFVNMKS